MSLGGPISPPAKTNGSGTKPGTNMKNTLLALLGFILLSTPLAASAQYHALYF